ncbi:MAG: iron-containing redox enzyme family protein [Calothrix sp. C42_A2020_038]|nr:iron-containing redox enzyme family protein [Calothrix sp. C42_A2020_038]
MHNSIMLPRIMSEGESVYVNTVSSAQYEAVENQFVELLTIENLDQQLSIKPEIVKEFEYALTTALIAAYENRTADNGAHRFLQRILYRINRLCLFWYDDLRNYENERSLYLQQVRNTIETAWQQWELAQIDVNALQKLDVKQALIERVVYDLNPELSEGSHYIREEMSETGYKHLLAIGSFDGLVEGSRLSRILGGTANPIQCTLVKVLLEEYGNGRLSRKHSTFFAQMLNEFGMNTEPEGYFDLVPWEVLACDNHNFLTTERKRYYLRYSGALTYFEVAGPSAYRNYLTAAQRLGLSDAAMGYWELHIREDERHGQWMLEDVALPLAQLYPNNAWELVLGYDQEKLMGERAAKAVVNSICEIDKT